MKIEDMIPNSIDTEQYKIILEKLSSKILPNTGKSEFFGAWNSVAYRCIECFESNNNFRKLIIEHGDSPAQPYRYYQERELFNFFSSGVSAIESILFAVYSTGSILSPSNFPIETEKDLTAVTLIETSKKFRKYYPNEELTKQLDLIKDANEFRVMKKIRIILFHRSTPGRLIFAGSKNKQYPSAQWIDGILIDINLTERFFNWLTNTLNHLINDMNTFISNSLLLSED